MLNRFFVDMALNNFQQNITAYEETISERWKLFVGGEHIVSVSII